MRSHRPSFPSRRDVVAGLASVIGLGTSTAPAVAQAAFPSKPVRLITPFAPGGPSDLIARLLGSEMEKRLGQPFIVESRAGAASNIGTAAVARSEPDGHTLLVPANNFMINPAIYKSVGYDPVADFAPITDLAASPCVIVASIKSGIKTFDDLLKKDRDQPGKMNYSTPGVGSPNHLIFEMLSAKAKLQLTHVPFQGGAPAMQAVLAGDVEIASTLLPNVVSYVGSNAFSILAVTGETRSADLPSVPTLTELGFPGVALEIVFMLTAPGRTPKPVIETLALNATEIMNTAAIGAKLRPAGFTSVARGPEAMKARIEREIPMFKALVADLNIPMR